MNELMRVQAEFSELLEREYLYLLEAKALDQVQLLEKKETLLLSLELELKKLSLSSSSALLPSEKEELLFNQEKIEKKNKRNLQLTLKLNRELKTLMKSLRSHKDQNEVVQTYNANAKISHSTFGKAADDEGITGSSTEHS